MKTFYFILLFVVGICAFACMVAAVTFCVFSLAAPAFALLAAFCALGAICPIILKDTTK